MRFLAVILFVIFSFWACKKVRSSETNTPYAVSDIYTNKLCAPLDSPYYLAYAVYVPSSFSPNGDGLNDVFTIKGKGINDFDLRVYNASNVQIYMGDINSKGWDGTVNGYTVPLGVYKFSLKTHESCRGIDHYYNGSISVYH